MQLFQKQRLFLRLEIFWLRRKVWSMKIYVNGFCFCNAEQTILVTKDYCYFCLSKTSSNFFIDIIE